MGSDFKLFHQKCQLTSICGGRLFPMQGALEGNTLTGWNLSSLRYSSTLSLPELQSRDRCDH